MQDLLDQMVHIHAACTYLETCQLGFLAHSYESRVLSPANTIKTNEKLEEGFP